MFLPNLILPIVCCFLPYIFAQNHQNVMDLPIQQIASGELHENRRQFGIKDSAELEKVGQILHEIRKRMAEAIKERTKLYDLKDERQPPLFEFGQTQMEITNAPNVEEEDKDVLMEEGEHLKVDAMEDAPNMAKLNQLIGKQLYQGDILLTITQAEYLLSKTQRIGSMLSPSSSFIPSTSRDRRQSLSAKKFPKSLWDQRTVPFTFHKSIDPEAEQLIRQAIAFWAHKTCLNFIEEKAEENTSATMSMTRLQFFHGAGCYSSVGKLADEAEQEISIGEGCEHFGIITHEIGHALGFFHEQSRWDRDNHVSLNVESILPGFEDQFMKEMPEDNDNEQVDYDYGSVMHYTESAFSLPHADPVLVAKERHNQRTMGQRIGPSFIDVLAMNRHYKCLEDCSANGDAIKCQNGGNPRPKNCSECICPWGFGGLLCDQRQPSEGPTNCGGDIQTRKEWAELRGVVGNGGELLATNFSSCHWHIRAPEGRQVELLVTRLGGNCSPGCFFGNVEFKIRANFQKTGIRVCCQSDLSNGGLRLKSETDLAVISLYTRKSNQRFRLLHRFI